MTALLSAAVIFLFEVSVRKQGETTPLWSVATFFGVITYCLYTVHEPIILALKPIFPAEISFRLALAVMPAAFCLSVGGAWLLYRLVEKPFDGFRIGAKPRFRLGV